jgi:type IV pilus assembly protein PilC
MLLFKNSSCWDEGGGDIGATSVCRNISSALSDALPRSAEIPGVVIQMVKVGEEAGELDSILKTLAKFYDREVKNAVDTLVDLIEPVMIVLLALGVGTLLASVLIPIYNVTSNIQ